MGNKYTSRWKQECIMWKDFSEVRNLACKYWLARRGGEKFPGSNGNEYFTQKRKRDEYFIIIAICTYKFSIERKRNNSFSTEDKQTKEV